MTVGVDLGVTIAELSPTFASRGAILVRDGADQTAMKDTSTEKTGLRPWTG